VYRRRHRETFSYWEDAGWAAGTSRENYIGGAEPCVDRFTPDMPGACSRRPSRAAYAELSGLRAMQN
jgi:hypothetical protein